MNVINLEDKKGIGVGIVTYNPDLDRLKDSLNLLREELQGEIVIVDNNSLNVNELKKIGNVTLISFEENFGISIALNYVFEYFDKKHYKWVLTMDQDSLIARGFLNAATPFLNEKHGIITLLDNPKIQYDQSVEYINKCITSGSLTNIEAWRNAGGFDDFFFIDYVDFDFCVAIQKNGYSIVRLNEFHLDHQLGNSTTHKFFWKTITTYNHSPSRTYYFVRNGLIYMKKNRGEINQKKEKIIFLKWLIVKLIYEKHKVENLKAIKNGWRDSKKYFQKD